MIKLYLLTIFTLLSCNPSTNSFPSQSNIHNQVAEDMIAQYKLSRKGGDLAEICVKAQIVAEAFNQAKDEVNYLKWKEIQGCECLKNKYPSQKKFIESRETCKVKD